MQRPVRVGIVGVGFIAREHARALAMMPGGATLVAAADVSCDRLAEFADTFKVPGLFGSAAELIADPTVDLVTVATPPSAHEEPALAALAAGKYVLCEKPLAHSLASARRILEAEARNPGRIAVSHQLRFGPQFRRLDWFIKHGWVGDITSGLIARYSYVPRSESEGYGWWGRWAVAGGGVLITQLVHELNMLVSVMGPPISVRAQMDTRYLDIESEDFVEATIQFAEGRSARCVAAVNSGYLGGGLEFQGHYGSIGVPEGLLLDDPQRQLRAVRAVDEALPDTRIVQPTLLSDLMRLAGRHAQPEVPPHTLLYREIVGNIKRGEALPISASEAMRSLELCMAIYESALRGREIALPLGSDNLVENGVRKSDYDARQRARSLITPVVFRRGDHRAPRTLRNAVVGSVKRGLALLNVSPTAVRAFVRTPAPVNGGSRVRTKPWPRRRHYDARERRAVIKLLNKEISTGVAVFYGGPEEDAYCTAFAKYLGGGYADAVNSGSNAVYIALRALGVEPGSEVIVPPVTDAGGTMPVALNLCIPVPSDSSPGSIMPTARQIEKVISNRTSAIVVAHLGGHPVDMDPILDLAAARGIPVVEDCAQAQGALYHGRMAGSIGAISAFSTMFGKQHATGGQGGVIFTKDPILYARAKQIADRGKSLNGFGATSNVVGSMNFNQDELSMAIGRVQLEKLPAAVHHRRSFAALVQAGLSEVAGVELIGDPPGCESSYWFLMVRIDPAIVSCDSHVFTIALMAEGIEGVHAGLSVYPTDQPWHRNAAVFGKSGLPWSLIQERPRQYALPNAHEANARMVRIEIHESLGAREAHDLVRAIRKIAQFHRC
jgi:perosamine synthetase